MRFNHANNNSHEGKLLFLRSFFVYLFLYAQTELRSGEEEDMA
jgi:hypothetical protein